MNFWLRPIEERIGGTAGGVASGTDILGAAAESMRLVDNSNSAFEALNEGYEEWRRLFKAGTGQDAPANPLVPNFSREDPHARAMGWLNASDEARIVERQRAEFQQFVNEQATRFPAEAVRSWSQFDPGQYAAQIARDADENLANLMESRPGWDKYIPAFAGAAGGSLRDPITLGSLALGGGPGAARTVLGRILTTAATEAGVNALAEAAIQPSVQDWRARVGLDSGFDQALANIGFAGALGGLFGAGGRGLVELIERQPAVAAARAALPAEVRGALDAADSLQAMSAQRPPAVSAPVFEQLTARADIAVARGAETPPMAPVIDELQVARIVDALAPERSPGELANMAATLELIRTGDTPDVPSSRPVLKFLSHMGGVDPKSDIGAELQAAGITSRHMPGIYRNGGRQAVDNIPIDEAQMAFPGRTDLDDGNGYVKQQAFIDAVTAEIQRQGEAVGAASQARAHFERRGVDFDGEDDAILKRMAEVEDVDRRYLEAGPDARVETGDLVHRAIELAGGPVDDAVIRAAVDMHKMEGEDLATAVDWALSDAAGVSRDLPAGQNWPADPPAPRGVDDPAAGVDEDWDWTTDIEALREFADPAMVRAAEDLAASADINPKLAQVVDACPF